MLSFEYVVVPAPRKAPKIKTAKTTEARFAHALTEIMNTYGAEGWEFLRSDTLPCDERSGLTGTKTVYQTVLVFRRALEPDVAPHAVPMADRVATPEQLAAELAPQAPAAAPAAAEAPPAPKLNPAPPQPAAHPPRLGPAAESGTPPRIHAVPLSAADRFERG